MNEATQAILDFWFLPPDDPGHGSYRGEWFRKDAAFDAEIARRFGAEIDAALAGRRSVGASPGAQLAQILLLDQFTRNVYRDTPRAFAGDAAALALATAMVAAGTDALLAPLQRWFVYLPFEHSEELAVQERSVALFAAFDQRRPEFASAFDYALRHRDIVARFGRFPHRNAILGRRSTPEEVEFLKQPGSGF